MNTNQRKPFKPSTVPSSTRGLEQEETPKVSYRELENELLPNSTPAFKRKQDSEVEAVQESLLEGLPETKVERRKAPEKPLTGKQRRAMKKSLSMIMEQEQQDRQLPYVHPKKQ